MFRKPMTSAATLRLMADLKAISQEPPHGCSASPASDENLFVWNATIFGPDETPWEGGCFSLRITFTEHYPSKPPRVRFTSDMFHPNVYQGDGSLCLDIIQDMWSPCQSVSSILTSIQSLLQDPNCSSPANTEASQLYNTDKKEYNRRMVEEKKQRRCLGTLYHSQARLNANKLPLCAGVKSKVDKAVDGPKESVPAGDFKYMCLGYSIYEAEQRKAGTATSSGRGTPDTIELPYCEGLEVISAAELLKSPAVLNQGTAGASASAMQGARAERPARPQPGRSFVPGGSGGDAASEMASLKERYMRSSQKVLQKMGSNLTYMGRTAQQTVAAARKFVRSWSED